MAHEAVKPVLCVIDMQYSFASVHNDRLVRNILNRIENYKQRKLPIITVAYNDNDDMHEDICRALNTYSRWTEIIKDEDDGSDIIASHISVDYKLELCGINLCYCVFSTASGLVGRGYKTSINLSCSGCTHYRPSVDVFEPLCLFNVCTKRNISRRQICNLWKDPTYGPRYNRMYPLSSPLIGSNMYHEHTQY